MVGFREIKAYHSAANLAEGLSSMALVPAVGAVPFRHEQEKALTRIALAQIG